MTINVHLHIDLDRVKTAANTTKFLLPITEFLDIEIAPAIKPTLKNKGNNIDSKYRLNGQNLWYVIYVNYTSPYLASIF